MSAETSQACSSADARLRRLRAAMAAKGLSAYIARATTDIAWMTGFAGVFDDERAHLVCVTAAEATLRSDARYSEALRTCAQDTVWHIDDEPGKTAVYLVARLGAELEQAAASGLPCRIGIEHDLPLDEFRLFERALVASPAPVASVHPPVELVECIWLVRQLRAVKDEAELTLHQRAQDITDAAFVALLGHMRPGVSEKHLAAELEFLMRDAGADGVAFPSIIASGPHAALPHAVPTERLLAEGDFVVMDFGATYQGYCADMTRTVCVGQASAAQRAIYEATLRAHEACKAAARPGLPASALHETAGRIIADAGYAGRFTHSLGHGVGLDIHELPFVGPTAAEPLEVGNVITIEPGIYVPGTCGVRIEDFGVITATGFRDFTGSPHHLIEL
jgi:Xaa-Pro aminopeptidase